MCSFIRALALHLSYMSFPPFRPALVIAWISASTLVLPEVTLLMKYWMREIRGFHIL